MGQQFDRITDKQRRLIESAPVFFVASVDPELSAVEGLGPVNVSPKGGVKLHVVGERRVAFLDYPGSGNETARHASAGGPITVMVCSFEDGDAAIVRLYGKARAVAVPDSSYADALLAEGAEAWGKPRQILEIDVERTQTSCGYGVPVLGFVRDRRREDRGRAYKGA